MIDPRPSPSVFLFKTFEPGQALPMVGGLAFVLPVAEFAHAQFCMIDRMIHTQEGGTKCKLCAKADGIATRSMSYEEVCPSLFEDA